MSGIYDTCTYEQASKYIAAHSCICRQSAENGKIDMLFEYVNVKTQEYGEEWETIDRTYHSIRAWLGY